MGNTIMETFFRVYMFLDNYKYRIVGFMWLVFWSLGFFIYYHIYGLDIYSSAGYALEQFAVSVKTPYEIKDLILAENNSTFIMVDLINNKMIQDTSCSICFLEHTKSWYYIYLVAIGAKVTLFLTIILFYFRKFLSIIYRKLVIWRGEHTIVVGLGRNSRFFIDSMLETKALKHHLIAFETDKNSPSLAKYKNERVSIVVGEVEGMMKSLNLSKCKNVFISTGSDKQNIYYALEFIRLLPEENKHFNKLVLHIENRTLRNLYADGNILSSKNIDIRIFSYYKESARLLFQNYPLEGNDKRGSKKDIIENGEDFSINVVGNSELVVSVVMEACRLAHYPKQNRLTINCIDRDIDSLEEKINYAFPEIKELKSLNIYIKYIKLDKDSLTFYQDGIWKIKNLKHIILCEDEIADNISMSTRLREITYLRYEREAQINIASMNHTKIASKVNKMGKGENIYSFARADEICSVENLLENYLDRIGQMISHLYSTKHLREQGNLKVAHTVELNSILSDTSKNTWIKAPIYHRRSSVGQALHIGIKLKILGLKTQKATNTTDLTWRNRKIFNEKLKTSLYDLNLWCKDFLKLEEEYINRESITANRYFPEKYNNVFEELLNIEHNRWMAVLILMDNIYDEDAKNKNRQKLKVHHLLKPFNKFETAYEKSHIVNDINALLNIPLYLAKVNYEIIDLD